ncbi:hypothetical protein GWI33_017232 [Rhynchophorus ferrugineus]|uniref:C3H1-type domain-containing protein n=1 Tax=Rhynchophorus ferrugineus TaxID=354439 RepID=A0A834I9K8_RHYFE|nr:hypothetical protein GWI33_017232 [Rhynchophorus ferrugineus]
MPVVESEDSRSASSDNESDVGSPRSARHSSRSSPESPLATGPQSPNSPRSVASNASSSRSNSPVSRSPSPLSDRQNGPRSPRSPSVQSNASSSGSSDGESQSQSQAEINQGDVRPETPKSNASYHSSPAHSQHSENSRSPQKDSGKSPASSRESSPEAQEESIEHSQSPKSPQGAASQGSDSEDNNSIKSGSSKSSRKSRSSVGSKKSRVSSRSSSRDSRRSRRKSESSSDSDGSVSSVDSSSRKNKDIRAVDTQPEDVSDGDMESDHDRDNSHEKPPSPAKADLNISHEDLSDVSDLEDSMGANSDDDNVKQVHSRRSNSEDRLLHNGEGDKRDSFDKQVIDKPSTNSRPEEGEEQLDFEAEDGECGELDTKDEDKSKEDREEGEEDGKDGEENENVEKEEKELEEGEVTDEDDARPEETEPRPVCRFFSRGACTWGASCRFLHPGVTDKGNYTMFDMVRPMLPGEFGMGRMMEERMYGKSEQPMIESAWERGLRTAKEMLKKSIRRKEQDIDFEEKKMNLSIAQEEFDKENGYYGRIPSPEPRYVRHLPEYPVARPPIDEYYGRRQVVYESEYAPPPRREHIRAAYREMPSHRGVPPEYFKYEEETSSRPHERMEGRDRERDRERRKPKREVIVQRGPEAESRPSRGDEWQDPWMRSKSPGRRKDRKKSYSSGSSSYSSSSSRTSSPSSKSSYRSRSRSSYRRGRSRSRKAGRHVSPSIIVSERKAANERAALMNPPAPKRRVPSPGMMRVSSAANPPAPSREDHFGRTRNKLAVAAALARVKSRTKRMSRSSSGSSSGSSSDSDSSESSSSSSRSNSSSVRDARKATEIVKAMDALKGGALEKNKIKLNLKNPAGLRKPDVSEVRKLEAVAKKRPANSPPPGDPKAKKATSRREELLKQLKAVEDAIAKKRSKV